MTPQALIAPARLAGGCLMRAQADERLIDLIRAGNERAFEAVVDRYRGPLLRHCRRFLPDGRAEDAVQQTLVRAHAGIVADVRPLRLKPWLFRIATNASIDMLRQPGWSHEPLDPDVDGVERPDQAFERHEQLRATIAAVKELPPRQRDVIVLRELEGRSYEEIAEELGLTGGAVRQLLHRGRAGLRKAASAFTPPWLIERLAWSGGGEPVAARVAELTAGGGAGIGAAVAAVVAAGTLAGGVALGPLDLDHGRLGSAAAAVESHSGSANPGPSTDADPVAPAEDRSGHSGDDRSARGPDSGDERDDEDRSGPGDGDGEDGDDRSGRRGGEAEEPEEDDDSGRRRSGDGTPDDAEDEPAEDDDSGSNSGPGGGGGEVEMADEADDDGLDGAESRSSGPGSSTEVSVSSGSGGGDDDVADKIELED
jgi:RNA polymerase sigma factor (sigma-70 family)